MNRLITYAELDGNGEEVNTDSLLDSITAGNTGEVDEAGLGDALLALDSLQNLLGEAGYFQYEYWE